LKFGNDNQSWLRRMLFRRALFPVHILVFLFVAGSFDYYLLSFERVYAPELPKEGMAVRLLEHVRTLAQPQWEGRRPMTEGNRLAADWVEDKFKSCGVRSFQSLHGYRQTLPYGLGDNVVGFRSAQNKSDRWIVVGAHFDHVGRSGFFKRAHLGADDNASSVAILIETACAGQPLKDTNIAFVAYNTEEPPYFLSDEMGSKIFVENLPSEMGAHSNILMSVSMDLMGGAHWRPLMESLFVVGASTGESLPQRVTQARADNLRVLQLGYHAIERLPWGSRTSVSDYVPYLSRRIPAVLLTVGRTPRYHDPGDTFGTLDYSGMERRTQWLVSFIEQLDSFKGAFTNSDAADLDAEVESLKPYAEAASQWRTRVPGSSLITIWHFKHDLERLGAPLNASEKRVLIERIVGRFQCAMMNLPICFLID
jgi:hypothetical protein